MRETLQKCMSKGWTLFTTTKNHIVSVFIATTDLNTIAVVNSDAANETITTDENSVAFYDIQKGIWNTCNPADIVMIYPTNLTLEQALRSMVVGSVDDTKEMKEEAKRQQGLIIEHLEKQGIKVDLDKK